VFLKHSGGSQHGPIISCGTFASVICGPHVQGSFQVILKLENFIFSLLKEAL
jgi:hypothetical protein